MDARSTHIRFGIKEERHCTLHMDIYNTCDQTERKETYFNGSICTSSDRTQNSRMGMETNVCDALKYEITNRHEVDKTFTSMRDTNEEKCEDIKCGKIFPNQKQLVDHGLSYPQERPPVHSMFHPEEKPAIHGMCHQGQTECHQLKGDLRLHTVGTPLVQVCSLNTGESSTTDGSDLETPPLLHQVSEKGLRSRSQVNRLIAHMGCGSALPLTSQDTNATGDTVELQSEDENASKGDNPDSECPTQRGSVERFVCDICGQSFSHQCDLTEHNGKFHPVGKTKTSFICEFCGRSVKKYLHFLDHRRTHTREKPFVCEKCGKRFIQSSGLRSHRQIHHAEKVTLKQFVCDVCGSAWRTLSQLKNHSVIHAAQRPYACKMCGKAFCQKLKLVRHSETHDPTKVYECPECGKILKSIDTLRRHKAIHREQKQFACELCSKMFLSSSALKRHRRTHTGEKPFVCKTCGKRFTQGVKLREHTLIHTGEKSHVCETCGKAFRRSYDLNVHVRIHTGEKPYVCRLCGAAFIVSAGLKKHQARIHP